MLDIEKSNNSFNRIVTPTTNNQPSTPLEIGISLGSNSGNRFRNLCEARSHLGTINGLVIIDSSPIYETEPVGVAPEHQHLWFLNTVVIASYSGDLAILTSERRKIEDAMGRVRSQDKNIPRTVDIDLIYAGSETIASETLTIPHPRWFERRFVVQPLTDVRPHLVLPGQGRTVQEILNMLSSTPEAKLFKRQWGVGRELE